MKFRKTLIVLASILVCISGCTSLGEVGLNDTVVLNGTGKALLKTDSEDAHKYSVLLDHRVFITGLDGKNLYRMGKTTDYPQALLIDPGVHTVTFKYLHNIKGTVTLVYANDKLSFEAVAEKRYIIRKEIIRGFIRFWIEDLETKEILAATNNGGQALTE